MIRQWNPIALTPMHRRHLELGATMAVRNGWMRVAHYTTAEEEMGFLQDGAGVADVSHRGKVRVHGTSIDGWLEEVNIPNLEIGHVARIPIKAGDSRIVVSISRLTADEVAITTGAHQARQIIGAIDDVAAQCLHATDVSSAFACIRTVGPFGRRSLNTLTEIDLTPNTFGNMRCLQGSFAGIYGMLIREDFGNIASYELYYPRELGEYVWDTLLRESTVFGTKPVGFESLLKIGSGSG